MRSKVLVVTMLVLVLVSIMALPALADVAERQGPAGPRVVRAGLQASAGYARVVRGHLSPHPTVTTGKVAPLPSHPAPPIPVDPRAPLRTGPPLVPQSMVAPTTTGRNGGSPKSFTIFKQTDMGAVADTIAEPSVASSGTGILETWNSLTGATTTGAVSTNGGSTFGYINGQTLFPSVFGGWCCDQVAQYDPSRDLYIWIMQYRADANKNNEFRLAVANGLAGLGSSIYHYWDLTPQQLGDPNGTNYDQPKLGLSNNFLYVEGTRYGAVAGKSVVLRMSLDTLASGGTLTYDVFRPALFGPGLVQGATTTMYFAAHYSTSTLRVYSWPESVSHTGVTSADVNHSAFPQVLPYLCPRTGVPSSDWCARPGAQGGYAHDGRINSGWVAGGVIGFSWDASQGTGGLGTFPFPYAHVVRINEVTKALVDEPILWNSAFAFAYMAVAPNAQGDLGTTYLYGGGPYYENCGGGIRDATSGFSWELQGFTSSNVDPANTGFSGDYLAARRNGSTASSWSVTCYALQNSGARGQAHPYYVSFGRSGQTPDFSISASPSSVTIANGNSGTTKITTTVSGGFNSSLSLSVSGLPTGTSASFNPSSIPAPGSGTSTMTITVGSSTPAGSYSVMATGNGGGKTHSATILLTVPTSSGNLLGNPGFENGDSNPAPWLVTAGVINNDPTEPPVSGLWDAWLDGYGQAHTDTLYQDVTIPSNASSATLKFWLHIDTAETGTTAYDTLRVQVRNTSNQLLRTLAVYSNVNAATGYTQKSFGLGSYIGQTIRIYLLGTEDISLQTSFVVDDFTLTTT